VLDRDLSASSYSFRLSFLFIFALIQPIILGIDHPIKELRMMPTNRYKNSGGIAGGSGLKLAVKVPYRLIVRFPEESPNGMVELRFRFSAQLIN
jgi:hypothetical protein